MNKRRVTAVASAALYAAVRAPHSGAALVFEIKATGISGIGMILDDKHVTNVAVGDVITYDVYADVTGTNSGLEGFQSGEGSIASSGPGTIQLNLTHARLSPFSANGSTDGTPMNVGGDSDTDIGPSNPQNTSVGRITYRSSGVTLGNATGISEFRLGTGTMTVSDNTGAAATVNFILAATTALNKNPLWQEDDVQRNHDPGQPSKFGVAGVGQPITIVVPEPACAGLLALGAAGLLRRRVTR